MAGPGFQLSLPLTQTAEPVVADAAPPATTRQRSRPPRSAGELSTVELLTTLIGPSASEPCRQMVESYASLRQLALVNPAIFADYGLTSAAVARLEIALELAKRYGESEWPAGEPFKGPADIYGHFREHLATEMHELFYAVLLDNKLRKIRDALVSKGSLTSSIVHPRDVFAQVIRYSAAAVVFVHNHPSGDPTPSKEDIEITRRLRDVGELIGVRVLDHIVIGKGRYVSFVDDGYW
jgi:DNA repair protein RadC